MAWFDWVLNPLGSLTDVITGGNGSGLVSSPLGKDHKGNGLNDYWDIYKNGNTNIVNRDIANENLRYQYDALEYNKALNQQIFERADTAYARQAQDAQSIGINPMALASTGGAQTGGSVAPVSPLHNDFQYQDSGIMGALAPLVQISDTLQDWKDSRSRRDLLSQQADMQRLQNAAFAIENGLTINKDGSITYNPEDVPKKKREFQDVDLRDKTATAERNERVNIYQKDNNINDKTNPKVQQFIDTKNLLPNSINSILSSDESFNNKADRLATYLTGKERINNPNFNPKDTSTMFENRDYAKELKEYLNGIKEFFMSKKTQNKNKSAFSGRDR